MTKWVVGLGVRSARNKLGNSGNVDRRGKRLVLGQELSENLVHGMNTAITSLLTPAFVPAVLFQSNGQFLFGHHISSFASQVRGQGFQEERDILGLLRTSLVLTWTL